MRPSRGFAAISAIFVLVVLAGLGVALVTISGAQQRTQAYDILGSQAYQAAHVGVENVLFEALRNSRCPPTTAYQLTGGLSAFRVEITCDAPTVHDDPTTNGTTIRQFTVTACNNATCTPATPPQGYVERQLRGSVCTGEC
jgi:MSHA biogenesis protein MshP